MGGFSGFFVILIPVVIMMIIAWLNVMSHTHKG